MKIIQILFCGIILAALAVPGWLTMMKPITGSQIKNSATERRRLVRFENIRDNWPNIKSTVQTFGQAFDDQLFARTQILQTVNGVLVNQAGHTTSDTILFGEDGYRFLMRRQNSKVFVQIPCAVPGGLDENTRQLTIDNYIAFAKRMQAKGVETRLVIIPTKSSIYPEKLPKYIHSSCEGEMPPAVDTVKQIHSAGYLARYDLDWFRSQSAAEIFQPQSFHWVSAKSHSYAQFLYENRQIDVDGKSLWPHKTKPIQSTEQADISRHLGIKENSNIFHSTEYIWPNMKVIRKQKFKTINGKYENLSSLDRSVALYSSHKSHLEDKLLMVGDSFSNDLFGYWASSASEAIFMDDTYTPFKPGIFDETVSIFGANIVVLVMEESKFAPIATENHPYPFATKLLPPK